MQSGSIINCDLLTRCDVAQGDEEDVIVGNFHVSIGYARVVDVVGTVSSATTVDTPTVVDGANS